MVCVRMRQEPVTAGRFRCRRRWREPLPERAAEKVFSGRLGAVPSCAESQKSNHT